MKHINRLCAFALVLALIISFLSGCGSRQAEMPVAEDELNIYATFYPFYALTEMLIKDVPDVELHCLVQPQDGCLRSYQLSDWDLALLVNSADAIISGGRSMESFEDILYALDENGPAVSTLLYDMELRREKAKNTSDDGDSHWLDVNTHIYLSIDRSLELARRIASSLVLLDEGNKAAYERNLQDAEMRLNTLQEEIITTLKPWQEGKVIVMSEALVYADESYGLNIDLYYERESGEDVSGTELENCLSTLAGSEARVVLIEKQAPAGLCKALQTAGYSVAKLDTMSTRSAAEGSEGYFEAHRENVQAINDAFAAVQ